MTTDLSVCQDIFNRDPVRYLDMTEAVRRGVGTVLHAWSSPPPPPWWASPPPMIPGTLEATSCPAPIWTPPACCAVCSPLGAIS